MTKRTQTNKPKAASTVAPTINSTAPISPTESVKAETKAKVATKGKQANSTAKKAPRVRSKKVVPAEQKKEFITVELVQDSTGKVVAQETRPHASAGNAVPSKYEQFKAWLVYKLYVVTSYFRGF